MAQTFYPTALQIITQALQDTGIIDVEGGVQPTTNQLANSLFSLNLLVTSWQAHGMQVWCMKTGNYTLSNASSYTIGPSGATITAARPLAITQAWLRDTDATPDVDLPDLEIISREEYFLIPNKEEEGTPLKIFYDPTYSVPDTNSGANANGKIYIWPKPSAAVVSKYDLYFIQQRPIQDFATSADALDFPQEWHNAVRWNLALSLCPGNDVPLGKATLIGKLAKDTLDLALSWDRELTEVTIHPSDDGKEE